MSDTPTRSVLPQTDNSDTATPGSHTPGSLPVVLPSEIDDATRVGPTPSAAAGVPLHVIGEYVVIKKIGEGGMGSVYLAEDAKLGRKVAIKTMRPELAADRTNRDRFEREARAAAAVEHENIVPIWGIGEAADGSAYIAMPFLQGEMLDSRLKRQAVAGLSVLLKVAREVADGLAAAHAKGLIHRDIKPGNIWLEGDLTAKELTQQIRRCKILDFGLARSVDKDDSQLTASGAILGTPAYMAPEQARAERVDHRADLWSLGVMLYRMASGHMPFKGANSMAVLIALTTETPPAVSTTNPNLPPALAALIDRLMCKDPAGRPQTAADVSAAVRQIVKDLQVRNFTGGTATTSQSVAPVAAALPPAWEEVTEAEVVAPPAPVVAEVVEAPKETRKPKRQQAAKRSRAPWFIAAGVLALLGLVALAVVILRVETGEGTLIVEINDPDVEARIKNGKLVLVGPDGKERYTITSSDRNKKIVTGPYTIRVEGADGLVLDTTEFTLKKGGQVIVRVTLDPKLAKKPDPVPPVPPGPLPGAYKNSTGMEFVKIPKGTGWLGGGAGKEGETKVVIEQDFYLGKFEVTQGEWEAVMGTNPSYFSRTGKENDAVKAIKDADLKRFPVENVSWVECQEFLKKLNEKEKGSGWVYRLPTAAEWEYACRGGPVDKAASAFDYYLPKPTNAITAEDAHGAGPRGTNRTSPVGAYKPNALGLYDMHGNVWEWCEDADGPNGAERVYRGGSFDGGSGYCRASVHYTRPPAGRAPSLGLRVARVPTGKAPDPVPAANTDADRKAAKWVLSVGGAVHVNGREAEIKNGADLPAEEFQLTKVLVSGPQVTDAALAVFKDCKNLTNLYLHDASVTATGLAVFQGSKTLKLLVMGGRHVTDEAMAVFKDCPNLAYLMLKSTQLTDAGLAHFKGCAKLNQLHLTVPAVTDAGLVAFKDCKSLTILQVNDPHFTDAGFAHFKDCTKLAMVFLPGTKLTDAGLAHFKDCKALYDLDVSNTSVTDAGLVPFKDYKSLRFLTVKQTKVTAKGVADFAKAQPQCKIEWDGGTIEPAKK